MKIWLLRIIGFIVGAGLALALEAGLLLLLSELFDKRLMPRGLGWIVIPIIVGISAAKIAPELDPLSKFAKQVTRRAPASVTEELQQAGRRMGAAAKQAFLFAEAAMLLPREIGFQSERARLGAGFFIAGATDFISQKHGLNDLEYTSVLSAILQKVDLFTESQADAFVDNLLQGSITELGLDGMIKGRNAISDWLGGKDDNAPIRLLTYIEEWSSEASDA